MRTIRKYITVISNSEKYRVVDNKPTLCYARYNLFVCNLQVDISIQDHISILYPTCYEMFAAGHSYFKSLYKAGYMNSAELFNDGQFIKLVWAERANLNLLIYNKGNCLYKIAYHANAVNTAEVYFAFGLDYYSLAQLDTTITQRINDIALEYALTYKQYAQITSLTNVLTMNSHIGDITISFNTRKCYKPIIVRWDESDDRYKFGIILNDQIGQINEIVINFDRDFFKKTTFSTTKDNVSIRDNVTTRNNTATKNDIVTKNDTTTRNNITEPTVLIENYHYNVFKKIDPVQQQISGTIKPFAQFIDDQDDCYDDFIICSYTPDNFQIRIGGYSPSTDAYKLFKRNYRSYVARGKYRMPHNNKTRRFLVEEKLNSAGIVICRIVHFDLTEYKRVEITYDDTGREIARETSTPIDAIAYVR